MTKDELLTNYAGVVLASSSKTRIKLLRGYIKNFLIHPHKVDESKFKKAGEPKKIVYELAKQKAISIQKDFPNFIIIGSDQILVCNQKILDKPSTLAEAKKNLMFLRNRKHTLLSSIFIIKNEKHFYSKTTSAMLYFNNISQDVIDDYIQNNKETVCSTVGSYKIEENQKYNFVEVIRGNRETIQGFPIKDAIKKLEI